MVAVPAASAAAGRRIIIIKIYHTIYICNDVAPQLGSIVSLELVCIYHR